MRMEHVRIPGRIGRWHSVDSIERYGVRWYVMEHDIYGDDAELVVVDEDLMEHDVLLGPLEAVVDDTVETLVDHASRPLSDAADDEERKEFERAREWCKRHKFAIWRVATE